MKYSKTIAGITIEICEKAIGEDLVLTLAVVRNRILAVLFRQFHALR